MTKNTKLQPKNNNIPQGSELKTSAGGLFFLNLVLLLLDLITLAILTYFYMQGNISFKSTGWFQIPESIQGYNIFLGLIILRLVIVVITHQLTEYIKNYALGTEKEKKMALHLLAGINILTIAIHLPLLRSLAAYIKGNEIIFNNIFLGTFRRILNENERTNLYQATVQNFLEKIETSKEIKEDLKKWAIEHTKTFLEKYDDGSSYATKYVAEKLEIQKKILQLEEIQKFEQASKIAKTIKNEKSWLTGVYNDIICNINPITPSDPDMCAIIGITVGVGVISGAIIYMTIDSIRGANAYRALNDLNAKLIAERDNLARLIADRDNIANIANRDIPSNAESIIKFIHHSVNLGINEEGNALITTIVSPFANNKEDLPKDPMTIVKEVVKGLGRLFF